uniref:SJCHGC06789 protein n=1 Tax=Schistosoma japonicum TaxID=6182 RepID=Q5DG02_SCHJA|nr:SJCHGC06789 protein [Schistosoma japonicum]
MCDPENPGENPPVNTGISNNIPPGNITLHSILKMIIRQRGLYTENILKDGFDGAVINSHNDFWFGLFTQAFLSPALESSVDGPGDDLLFYVHHLKQNNEKPELSVFRRNSSNLPKLTDDYIDWEETVYLNLLMQYFVYVVTIAVCTRTGPQEWQILKKFSHTVYSSPSHRQMNVKGSYEQIAYPDLYFTIDNYEEAFAECVLRDSECLNIELTAYNRSGQVHGVCFLGTISYSTIKQFYDHLSHASRSNYHPITLSRHRNNRMTNSSYSSTSPILDYTSTQFMRVIGPQANGLVEIAIKPMQNMTQQLTLDLSKIDEINHTNFITKCCQPVCPSESEMEYNSADNWMLNDISCCMNKTVGSEVITQQPVIVRIVCACL